MFKEALNDNFYTDNDLLKYYECLSNSRYLTPHYSCELCSGNHGNNSNCQRNN